jgi:Ca-activated chloride channel homolog
MSLFLRFALLSRVSSIVAVLLFVPVIPFNSVQAAPRPPETSGACRSAELIPPDDRNVQQLRSLLQKYAVSLPYPDSIGERPNTRYEVAIALDAVLTQTTYRKLPSKQDLRALKDLYERFKPDLIYLNQGIDTYQTYFESFEQELAVADQGNRAVEKANLQALQELANRYGVPWNSSISTRFEFAVALNEVLDRINEQVAAGRINVDREDLKVMQRLQEAYTVELAIIRGRVDALESRTSELERGQFSIRRKVPTRIRGGAGTRLGTPSTSGSGGNIVVSPQSMPSAPIAPPTLTTGGLPPEDRLHKPGTGNTEGYNVIDENPFQRPLANPLSTFSIDVDTASYSNIRRFISQGQLPPKDAVRIEELINYFPYDYPEPKQDKPFSISTEVATAPWNAQHKLVQIGLKGKQLKTLQPSNLVFLVDVSGSMAQPNKLPLVKQSLCQLVNELSPQDRVTMVVYAGNAGLVLPPTLGNQKTKIMAAIDQLEAGGSTAGGAGIELAYKMAQQNFLKNGNNRVILATDGDFNVGVSSDAELVRLIEQKRNQGVFLTILGFGTGNYKDSKMEALADKGNGNYAYIDTLMEARKVLVNDLRGTLFTIAKDVKIQVEFNPAKVQAYRLIGYENRLLRDQDFNDDTKDAGEIGSGHTVTALYEVIPTGIESDVKLPSIDPLKYQPTNPTPTSTSDELLQVKLRYKAPTGNTSQLISQVVPDRNTAPEAASANLKFSSAVALYGMLLRDSEFKGKANFDTVLRLATQAKGGDRFGYRTEFVRLVERSKALTVQQPLTKPISAQ